jgi:hypothetical protein
MPGIKRNEWVILAVILIMTAGWKIILLSVNAFPFNADEAIVALMARHALQGQIPIFFYGQAYMGSLDALLVASLFALVGEKVICIRIVQLVLYLLTIITTVEIGRVGFRSVKIGLFAAALLSIPAVNMTLYSTISLGGYGETLLLGNLILISGIRILNQMTDEQGSRYFWLGWLGLGIFTGIGLWADGLTLVYSAPTLLILVIMVYKNRKAIPGLKALQSFSSLFGGVFIGAMPWWIFAFQNGLGQLTSELMGTAVNVDQASLFQQLINRVVNLLLIGMTAFLGFRPPWAVIWLAFPVIPFVLFFWGWVMVRAIKKTVIFSPIRPTYWFLSGIVMTLALGFVSTPFGNDPSGRYFLPMTVPFALAAADLLTASLPRTLYQGLAVSGIMAFHLIGTWQCVMVNPPGITTQFDAVTVIDHQYDSELISFLKDNHEYYGYSNYWTAYPLAFESGEQLIFIPRLPYHQDFRYTIRDDRYAPYRTLVESAKRTAYITTNHPDLDEKLRTAFTQRGVNWKEKKIGNYQVFYDLSQTVRPEEIGLGDPSKP